MTDKLDWVRRTYDVPAYVGRRVTAKESGNRKGTIVAPEGSTPHVPVVLDGERRPGFYHPNSLTYLADTEPPAPPLKAKPTEHITINGQNVNADPWMTECSRIVFLKTEWSADLVTGNSMAREYWDSYGLADRLEAQLPDYEGLYQATLRVTIWPCEGDHDFNLEDIATMAPPEPAWAKRTCAHCGSNAVHPWPYVADSPEQKRYRCTDCERESFLDPRPEPYFGKCPECGTAIHQYAHRVGRCEQGHEHEDAATIYRVPPERPGPAPEGQMWCHCRVYYGFKPHLVPAKPKEILA